MKVQLGDFAPDLDPVVAGFTKQRIPASTLSVLTDTQYIYSTLGGWKNLPQLQSISEPLPSQCLGAYAAQIAGSNIVVLAIANQLYLFNGGALANQGLSLTNTANVWYFTVYGNDLVGVDGVDPAQVSTSGGNFAALGGSPPVFSIIEATDYSLFGIVPDSSQYYFTFNDTIWTPNIATQTGTGVLTATSGTILAAKALRSGIAMYKYNSLYIGQYAGPPFFWQFTKISDKVGTRGAHAVVSAATMHFFIAQDDFYSFDGYNLLRLENNLRKWFLNDLNANYDYLIFGIYDQPREQIIWWYPSVEAAVPGTLDRYISYSLLTGKWARGSLLVDLPMDGTLASSQAWTWKLFENTYGTWGAQPNVVYGSPIWGGSTQIVTGTVDSLHTLNGFIGAFVGNTPAYLQTGYLGDKVNLYAMDRARPGFLSYPSTLNQNVAECTVYGTYIQGQAPQVSVGTQPISDIGSFDFVTSNRLQSLQIGWYSDAEIADVDVDIQFAGTQ